MRITRSSCEARLVRSGPPTTATLVTVAITPPLQVRPTAMARCPTRGSSAVGKGGAARLGTRTTARPAASA